jgi:hypothetical protein
MREPEFDAAYREAKRVAFGQSIARLQQGTSAAATTLLKVMIDPSAPVRVRAADSVLNHAAKAIEVEDIEARCGFGNGGERNATAMRTINGRFLNLEDRFGIAKNKPQFIVQWTGPEADVRLVTTDALRFSMKRPSHWRLPTGRSHPDPEGAERQGNGELSARDATGKSAHSEPKSVDSIAWHWSTT